MLLSSLKERVGNVEYEYDVSTRSLSAVYWQSAELTPLIWRHLHLSEITIMRPFDRLSKEIKFCPIIEMICNDLFRAIEKIKKTKNDEYLAAVMASFLFERFTNYWVHDLLENGKDIIGVLLWQNVLEITKKWEDSVGGGIRIHKGTLYYFLAESYFLIGDRDLAFVYLFNALEEDKNLGTLIQSLNYPDKGPAYLTAALRADPNNHMYYIDRELRDRLDQYITKFQKECGTTFSLHEFDTKLLHNKSLFDLVTFFVFNFFHVYEFSTYMTFQG